MGRQTMERAAWLMTMGVMGAALWSSTARAAPRPDLVWGTYLGGKFNERGAHVATGGDGSVHVCGQTMGFANLSTPGAHKEVFFGKEGDAYLMRFTPEGERVWGTYFGGSELDGCTGLAVDGAGNIVIVGNSRSTDGIATPGALQPINAEIDFNGFAARFDPTGALLWGTYLGPATFARGVASDLDGNIHVIGEAGGPFPFALAGAFDDTHNGEMDAFLLRLAPDGSLLWGTFYGGSGQEECGGVTAGADAVYLVGRTESELGIASEGALDTDLGGTEDGFIVRFDAAGVRQWATYYGGVGADTLRAAAVTPDGGVVAFGHTISVTGIATPGAHQPALAGSYDGMVIRLDAAGSVQWATYLGGPAAENAGSVVIDPAGNLLLTGRTGSLTGIATLAAFQPALGGGLDAFLVKLSPAGTRRWGTYLGDSALDSASDSHTVAVAGLDTIYVTGETEGAPAIITPGSFQVAYGGDYNDGFLLRLTPGTLDLGDPCLADGDCESGFCVDNACCDGPCDDGDCMSGMCVPDPGGTTGDTTGDTTDNPAGTTTSGDTSAATDTTAADTGPDDSTGSTDTTDTTSGTPTTSATAVDLTSSGGSGSSGEPATGGGTTDGGGCGCMTRGPVQEGLPLAFSLLAWRRRGRRLSRKKAVPRWRSTAPATSTSAASRRRQRVQHRHRGAYAVE